MFWIVSSLTDALTWYVFRENSQEVKVVLKNNVIRSSHELNINEEIYFKKHILQTRNE